MAQLQATTVSGDLVVDTDVLVVDSGQDRVAVNGTTPAYELDVTGTVRADDFIGVGSGLTDITAAQTFLISDDDGDTRVETGDTEADSPGFPDPDQLTFITDGTTRLTIDSAGQADFQNDVVVQGDLTVSGTTTTVNSTELSIGDNIITLNGDVSGSPTQNAGIEVERGTDTNAVLQWNESGDYWELGTVGSTTEIALVGDDLSQFNNDLSLSSFPIDLTTDDISEGSTNLYYTEERVDDRVAALIQDGTGISFSYSDVNGTLTPTVTLAPFDTDDLTEGASNLYFTDARAVTALENAASLTLQDVTTNDLVVDGTVTINGTLSSDQITEGSGNLFFTDERVDDRVAALLIEGTGVTLTYDDTAGTLEVAANLSGATGSTDDLTEGSTNLFFTEERAQDAVFPNVVGGIGIDVTYDDTAGTLTIDGAANSDQITEGSQNLFFTEERVDDRVNDLLVGGTGITLTYDDTGNVLTIDAQSIINSTDDVAEGSTNLYFTDARAVNAVTTGITTDDLTEGSTNLFFTEERVDDRVDQLLIGGDGITLTYDDTAGSITIDSDTADLDNTYIRNDGDTAAGDYDFNTGLFVLNQSANEITSDGDFTTTGTVTANQLVETSTKQVKDNIKSLSSQLDNLKALRPVSFDWKTNGQQDIGLIAEEVNMVYPELVKEENGQVLGINYTKLTSVLISALQDLSGKVERLEAQLA